MYAYNISKGGITKVLIVIYILQEMMH